MKHPYECISATRRRLLYWLCLFGTLAVAGVLGNLAQGFAQQVGNAGESYDILAFEFAHTPDTARRIVEVWGEAGVAAAQRQTWFDFVFLLLYPNAIALGILAVIAGTGAQGWVATAGRSLAWAQWLAGFLDAVENAMLLRILSGEFGSPGPEVAFYCATIKFVIVVAGILYLLACLPLAWKTEPTPG